MIVNFRAKRLIVRKKKKQERNGEKVSGQSAKDINVHYDFEKL